MVNDPLLTAIVSEEDPVPPTLETKDTIAQKAAVGKAILSVTVEKVTVPVADPEFGIETIPHCIIMPPTKKPKPLGVALGDMFRVNWKSLFPPDKQKKA